MSKVKPRLGIGIDFEQLVERAAGVMRETLNAADVFDFDDVVLVLQTALKFNRALPEPDRRDVVINGLGTAAKHGEITPATLVSHISEAQSRYLERPLEPFTLATSISLAPDVGDCSTRFNGARIDVREAFPRAIAPARVSARSHDDTLQVLEPDDVLPSGYRAVCVRVRARSTAAAADQALETLKALRGIWNFARNLNRLSHVSTGEWTPINRIRLGRVHTLHTPNGRLAHPGYHYEPTHVPDRTLFAGTRDFAEVRKFERLVRRRLSRIRYRSELVAAVARYARTLDTTDYDSALLKLWALLEFLTGTTNAGFGATVARGAFMHQDARWTTVVLEHLRQRRNEGVHADVESASANHLVWQLKRYVESAFRFHIAKRGEFGSRADAARFLSMPHDADELRSKLEDLRTEAALVSRALTWRSPKKPPDKPPI